MNHLNEDPQDEHGLSVREQLEKVVEEEKEEDPVDEPETTDEAEPEAPEGDEAPEGEPEADTEESPPETADTEAEQPGDLEPNPRFPKETQALFKTLPSDAQKAMNEIGRHMQVGLTKKTQELAEKSKSYDRIENSLARLDPMAREDMVTREQIVDWMTQTVQNINTDRQAGIRTFLDQLKVKPEEIYPQSAEDTYYDEATQKVIDQNKTLQKRLDQLEQGNKSQQDMRVQQQEHALKEYLENDFALKTDPTSGNLLYPRFQEVRGVMAQLWNTDMARDVKSDEERLAALYAIADHNYPPQGAHATPEPQAVEKKEVEPEVIERSRKATDKLKPKQNKQPDASQMTMREQLKAVAAGTLGSN